MKQLILTTLFFMQAVALASQPAPTRTLKCNVSVNGTFSVLTQGFSVSTDIPLDAFKVSDRSKNFVTSLMAVYSLEDSTHSVTFYRDRSINLDFVLEKAGAESRIIFGEASLERLDTSAILPPVKFDLKSDGTAVAQILVEQSAGVFQENVSLLCQLSPNQKSMKEK